MYSGGQGYYWLLDQLGQPASYFCLRNDDWQLLAMDTGLHDADPGTVISNLTYLDERELAWQRDKIANAGGRKTILLSHHQLFSAAGGVGNTPDGRPLAVNPRLYDAFADVLDQVALWMWGHEHNLIIYDEYAGLARGSCNGSAAVPTLLARTHTTPDPHLVLPAGQSSPPIMSASCRLGDNGEFYAPRLRACSRSRANAASIDITRSWPVAAARYCTRNRSPRIDRSDESERRLKTVDLCYNFAQ